MVVLMSGQASGEQIGGVSRNGEVDESTRIVIDRSYLRDQARTAMLTLFAPLSGVYMAATGARLSGIADDSLDQGKRT